MAKNKNNQAIWNTRIKKNTSKLFAKVGSSIDIDKRLYKEDIKGSIAHVEMLFKQKIITFRIKNKIIYGLQKIEKQISKNNFEFNQKYEDIHMNIEKQLFQMIGEEAGYVHTARSRNDQVITDFKLWIKSATEKINLNIEKIIKSTLKLSEKNIETIMPGFTHLKNAQPISLADELFSLWKERKTVAQQTAQVEKQARKQQVRAANTGNARGSAEGSRKKVYRRADIIKLMKNDPDRYQALSDEIMAAYAEGRVK